LICSTNRKENIALCEIETRLELRLSLLERRPKELSRLNDVREF
jgi:hypothetical protein